MDAKSSRCSAVRSRLKQVWWAPPAIGRSGQHRTGGKVYTQPNNIGRIHPALFEDSRDSVLNTSRYIVKILTL